MMPGWKSTPGKQIDETVEKAFANVRKQLRWNTPFYGKEDGWFLTMYGHKTYVQMTFMTGFWFDPIPPKASKVESARYLDIHEGQALNKEQLASWIDQVLKLPGQKL